ncbi:N-acetyltransferase family protein [Alkalibacterium sp. f15]|uniref:GNAT family N-acetyltransferase n=1 Tax=Alkalibacterium sp. f15 TaxID=3414029 RepID=UPI003BF8AC03
MDYSIEPATKEDISFLWEMLHQSVYVPEGQQAVSLDILKEPTIAKYLINWGNDHDHALIAKGEDNNPLGAVWIRLFSRENAGYGFINEDTPELGMAIKLPYRGQGIGKDLLTEMIDLALSIGYPALSLSVDPHNKKALRLYENSGFIKVNEDDGGSWTMKRDL